MSTLQNKCCCDYLHIEKYRQEEALGGKSSNNNYCYNTKYFNLIHLLQIIFLILYSVLFWSGLFWSGLVWSSLVLSGLVCSVLFCSVLFCSVQIYIYIYIYIYRYVCVCVCCLKKDEVDARDTNLLLNKMSKLIFLFYFATYILKPTSSIDFLFIEIIGPDRFGCCAQEIDCFLNTVQTIVKYHNVLCHFN